MEAIVCRGNNGGVIDREALEQKAAERQLAPGLEQRRDESGQFVSRFDPPARGATGVVEPVG